MQSSHGQTHCVTTPIKINLALHVLGQKDNGYHLLESLVAFSFDGDVLQSQNSSQNALILDGPFSSGLSIGPENLVNRARLLLQQKYSGKLSPTRLHLTKNLPVASGVGGGSGDAAATLYVLQKQVDLPCTYEELIDIALQLGADVPMCLSALMNHQCLLVKGIGEEMKSLPDVCPIPIVLVNHGEGIATPAVFQALERRKNEPLEISMDALKTLPSLIRELEKTRNDLFEPALKIAPSLKTVLDVLNKTGASFSRMSGSGATCFGIYKNFEDAQIAAKEIKENYPDWFVKPIITVSKLSKDH